MTYEQGTMSAIPAKLPREQIEQSLQQLITSDHLRRRARCYRLAAAVADVRGDVATFGALAICLIELRTISIEPGLMPVCARL